MTSTSSPTITQQRALAFAPKPFAILSFGASAYVMCYLLLTKERVRLKRLYHRLILMMNVGLLMYSFNYVFGSFAVPEGTPNYAEAHGNIQTCTVNGFLAVMFSINIPIYYASLSLQAFMGIRHNFKEEKYIWIEKWVHLVAYLFPCAIATVFAATQNYNPSGAGCYVTKAPRGCESDPSIPCTRGEDIKSFELIIGLSLIFLYFIFPPSVMASMYCWIKKVEQNIEVSIGMQRVREEARREMMKNITKQICVYLLSFWCTWGLNLGHAAYQTLSGGKILYNLLIFAHCIHSSQGWIFSLVYFGLERMGTPKVEYESTANSGQRPAGLRHQLTVRDIRLRASRRSANESAIGSSSRRSSFIFNIFDGTPDEDSPWAKFIDGDFDEDSDGNEDVELPEGEGAPLPNSSEQTEQA